MRLIETNQSKIFLLLHIKYISWNFDCHVSRIKESIDLTLKLRVKIKESY